MFQRFRKNFIPDGLSSFPSPAEFPELRQRHVFQGAECVHLSKKMFGDPIALFPGAGKGKQVLQRGEIVRGRVRRQMGRMILGMPSLVLLERRDLKMKKLRTSEKLIITVATTGAFQGKEANPNLPLTPEEIAQGACDAWNEGASIIHVHAREKETNRPTSDPGILMEIDGRIREKKCDIIIQHSTASDYIPRLSSDRRIKAIEMNPEMASLDITIPRMITFGGKESILITTLPEIEYGAKAMLDRGIKPELEVFNPVLMEDTYQLIEKGLLTKPYWFSFVMGMRRINRAYMGYSLELLIQLVNDLPPDSMFSVMGVGSDELPATTQSILLGGHVRVGFEDNIFYRKGQLAQSNAQLVARAARIGKELGCEIVSPAGAREMLGIPPLHP